MYKGMSILKKYPEIRHSILYGLLMADFVFLLKWCQWQFLIMSSHMEIYVGLIAVFFTALGLWLSTNLAKPKVRTVIIEKEVYLQDGLINEQELQKLNLSAREYEVLQLLSKGYTYC